MEKLKTLVCETQGRIYKHSVELGYNTRIFSQMFLKSECCAQDFDTIYSVLQFEMPSICMGFILPEIGNSLVKDEEELNKDKAYFVGYMYRYLYYITGYTSSEILDKVPYETILNHFRKKDNIVYAHIAIDICKKCGLDIIDRETKSLANGEKE